MVLLFASIGMGCYLFYLHIHYQEIKRKLSEMNGVLIGLIDRIRMLDNDLIRLRSKLNTVLAFEKIKKRKIK